MSAHPKTTDEAMDLLVAHFYEDAQAALAKANTPGTPPTEQEAAFTAYGNAYSLWQKHGQPVVPKPKPEPPIVPVVTTPDAYKVLEDRTGQGNANLLIRLADGNLRYVAETKQWLRWTGLRWTIDTHESFVTSHALEVAKYYLCEARAAKIGAAWRHDVNGNVELADDLFKWAKKCRNKSAIDEMITLARKVPGVSISITELDRNPWLLGVENGVVDLKTGVLREAESREDYVTKRCAFRFDPAAKAPRWEALIIEATGSPLPVEHDAQGNAVPSSVGRYTPRPAFARYLHKALGYSLTAVVKEQKMFIPIGGGSNSKGIVFDATKEILGPYAVTIPSDALMATKFDADAERPTALAATLAGARFVVASETREGQKLNVAMIKAHTGDRQMTARKMRTDPFTFDISHKLWLLTNHPPAIDHLDDAIKGRLHLVPFDRQWNRPGVAEHNPELPDGDKELATTLKGEYEGILAWLVRGAALYDSEGLTPPSEVTIKTREYVLEQDHFGRWLATMRKCGAAIGTKASALFLRFTTWCGVDGCKTDPATQTAFSKTLAKRGIPSIVRKDGTYWGLAETPPAVGLGDQVMPPGVIPPK
jgi:putative DNA primase/helicase